MKYLTLFAIFLMSFHMAFGVHWCYTCDDCEKNKLEEKDCRTISSELSWLCVSRANKTSSGSTVINKGCMQNNAQNIGDCDKSLVEQGLSCYNCDREFCNSASRVPASILFAMLAAFLLLKFA